VIGIACLAEVLGIDLAEVLADSEVGKNKGGLQ